MTRNGGIVATLLVGLVALNGCRTGEPVRTGTGVLSLDRRVTIAAGRARAYFQGGRQQDGANLHAPHCELEISTVAEHPQTVEPDRFVITRSGYAMVGDEQSRMPAFPGMFRSFHCTEDIFYESRFRLASDLQPGVRQLICRQAFDNCRPGRYLNPAEIEAVLGPGFRFE